MSDTNEGFVKSFRECIFQLRNHPEQCKEAVELLNVHMKYHPLDETMLYEYMIVAFYAGENVDDIVVKVLNDKKCRLNDCLSNYKFYNTTITSLRKIEYTNKEGHYYSSTPSIMLCPDFMKKDFAKAKYIMNQRFVNYKIVDGNKYFYEEEPRHPLTFNRRLMLDENFEIIDNKKLKGNLEDIRIYEYDQNIYFSSSFLGHRNGEWGVSICTGLYPTEKNGKPSIGIVELKKGEEEKAAKDEEINEIEIEFDLLTTVKNENVEKNWALFEYNVDDSKELCFVYQWYPLVIGKINRDSFKKITIAGNVFGKEEVRNCYNLDFIDSVEMPYFFKNARGSTNCFNYFNRETNEVSETNGKDEESEANEKDELKGTLEKWFIVHIVSYEVPRHYYNAIAIFDEEMNLIRYSYPFKFSKDPIEYALGLIVTDSEVIISYSTWDKTSNVAIYDKKYIDSLIRYE